MTSGFDDPTHETPLGAPRCTRWDALESLAVFAFGIALFAGVYGTRVPGQSEVGLPGHDCFYHVKMAMMLPDLGLPTSFPWLRFAYFTRHGDEFVSHHYGFHVLLLPFVRLGEAVAGDPMAGARWAIVTFSAVNLVLFNLLLRAGGVRGRWLWLILYVLMPYQFFIRHAFIRAIAPSLSFMLLILLLLIRGRHRLAAVAMAGYVHLYLGAVLYIPVVVALWAAGHAIGPRETRVVPWRAVLWAAGGWLVGILTFPYLGGMFDFLRLQVLGTGLSPDIEVGAEWKPYSDVWWFAAQMSGALLTSWIAALCVRLRWGPTIDAQTLAMLLINVAFLLLTLKARRFIEYWPVLCLLSAAYLAAPPLAQWCRPIDAALADLDTGGGRAWAIVSGASLVAAAAAFAVTGHPLTLSLLASWKWALAAAVPLALLHVARHRRAPAAVTVLALSMVAAGATVAAAAPGWREVIEGARCKYDLRSIREMMAWVIDHSAPGDVIFTDDWDVFPVFFYHNTHNHYVVGLDPKFTHDRRPDLWERYVRITRGEVPTESQVMMPDAVDLSIRLEDIRTHFGAKFVIVDRDHGRLAGKLAAAPQLAELVYPSPDYATARRAPYMVFRIRGAEEPVPAGAASEDETGGDVFLGTLRPRRAVQGWGDLTVDRNVNGGPLRLGGRSFDRGLGTHAPATLQFDVPPGCEAFEAVVGVDAAAGEAGSVIVSVLLDGRQAFVSGMLRSGGEPIEVRVAVEGASSIVLKADATADGNRDDHVDWADARFVCAPP